jgi:hypothetical protein
VANTNDDDEAYAGYAIVPINAGHVGDEIIVLFGSPAAAELAARTLGIVDMEIRPVRLADGSIDARKKASPGSSVPALADWRGPR